MKKYLINKNSDKLLIFFTVNRSGFNPTKGKEYIKCKCRNLQEQIQKTESDDFHFLFFNNIFEPFLAL